MEKKDGTEDRDKGKEGSQYEIPTGDNVSGLRDSLSVPMHIGSALEAIPSIQSIKLPQVQHKPEQKCCLVWAYLGPLTVLCIITLALTATCVYLMWEELRRDLEFNEILENKRSFSKTLKRDTYFGGKKVKDVPVFAEVLKMSSEVKSYLQRDNSLEKVALSLAVVVLVLGTVQIVAFVLSNKFRNKLKITYLGYGIAGILLFIVGSLMGVSALGWMNTGYLSTRDYLEDAEFNSSSHHAAPPPSHHHQGHGGSHRHKRPAYCKVNETHPNVKEREELWTIVNMCVYRHSNMNKRDPCPKVYKSAISLGNNNRSYSQGDLEDLNVCFGVTNKLWSAVLAALGALLGWIIMWLGSHARHSVLKPSWKEGVWPTGLNPKSVTGIDGWTARSNIPSAMQIESSMRPSNIDLTVPSFHMEISPPIAYAGKYASLTTVQVSGSGPLYPGPSVMTMIPEFIIHPPHIRSSHRTDTLDEEPKAQNKLNQSWFVAHD